MMVSVRRPHYHDAILHEKKGAPTEPDASIAVMPAQEQTK